MANAPESYKPARCPLAAGSTARVCRIAFLSVWGLGTSVVVASLMGSHLIPIPAGASVATAKPFEQASGSRSRWQAVHVLSEGCPCSAAVAEYLLRRGPAADVSEQVWIAGDGNDLSNELAPRGFKIQRVTAEQLHHAHGASVLGAPWLLLFDPQGTLAYSGGYAERRPQPGVELEDLKILHQLQSGRPVAPMPAFGCAVDPDLKKTQDPLGLKYR